MHEETYVEKHILNQRIWNTREGVPLRPLLYEMDERHLRNTIAMLQKESYLIHLLEKERSDLQRKFNIEKTKESKEELIHVRNMTYKEFFQEYVESSMIWETLNKALREKRFKAR